MQWLEPGEQRGTGKLKAPPETLMPVLEELRFPQRHADYGSSRPAGRALLTIEIHGFGRMVEIADSEDGRSGGDKASSTETR